MVTATAAMTATTVTAAATPAAANMGGGMAATAEAAPCRAAMEGGSMRRPGPTAATAEMTGGCMAGAMVGTGEGPAAAEAARRGVAHAATACRITRSGEAA